jgi:hypothetical protein
MLLHDDGKIEIIPFVIQLTNHLLVFCQHKIFNEISKYEAEVDDSVVSFNFKFTRVYGIEWKCSLLVDEKSLVRYITFSAVDLEYNIIC